MGRLTTVRVNPPEDVLLAHGRNARLAVWREREHGCVVEIHVELDTRWWPPLQRFDRPQPDGAIVRC
jgi:hypothetical protein